MVEGYEWLGVTANGRHKVVLVQPDFVGCSDLREVDG